MKTLQSLTDLGVTHLCIENREAVTVNPYEKFQNQSGIRFINKEWVRFNHTANNIPPLPCPTVEDGTYPVEAFEEGLLVRRSSTGTWVDGLMEAKEIYIEKGFQTRLCLVLKEQVAETDLQKAIEYALDDNNYEQAIEVAEKPEGESQAKMPGSNLAKNFPEDYNSDNGRYLCYCWNCKESFFGRKRRTICKECLNTPPEAQPVESAEDGDYQAEDILSKKTCYYPDEASTELGGGVMLFMEKDILEAMEEYASLRVAQALKK